MSWTLSRYIGGRFLTALAWSAAGVLAVIFLGNLIELTRRNDEGRALFSEIVAIAALSGPSVALTAAPFVVMLATLATLARLARTSELVVIRAAGVSVWRILAPVVVCAVGVGLLTPAALNPLAAAARQRAETLEARHLEGRPNRLSVSGEGVWLRQSDGAGQSVIHARAADGRATHLRDVTVFAFGADGGPVSRIDAAAATLTPGAWVLRDALRRDLRQTGGGTGGDPAALAGPEDRHERLETPTDLTPDQILDSFESPEAISFWRLPAFIATLEAAGFSAARHRLHWQAQLATPVLFAGMALIGAAFSMRHVRLGGLGVMALGAVLTGFGFYFLTDVAKALGASGAIPATLAAWAPPLAALLFASGLLLHLEDG